MSRLPNPGGDNGAWGEILNDFLLRAHSSNGQLRSGSVEASTIANGAVESQAIAHGSIGLRHLGEDVITRLNNIEAKIHTPISAISLFGHSLPNEMNVSNGGNPLELGTRFIATTAGSIIGLRFFKDGSNTGHHTGTLRNANGTVIKSLIFENETASGWQVQLFDEPAPIAANTQYIASYYSPTGNFSRTTGTFDSPLYVQNLIGPAGTPQNPNGIYKEGAGAPDTPAYMNASYFVDVLFLPA